MQLQESPNNIFCTLENVSGGNMLQYTAWRNKITVRTELDIAHFDDLEEDSDDLDFDNSFLCN